MDGNIAQYVLNALQQQNIGLPQQATMPNFGLQRQQDSGLGALLDQIDAQPMTQIPPMGPQISNPQVPFQPMGGPQTPPVPTNNVSSYIQEALGAKEPTSGDFLQTILSKNNAGPSFDDYGQAIQKSAYDTPTGAQGYADANLKSKLEQITALQKLSAGTGGATGDLVRSLRQEDPNLSFKDALYQVQTGFRKGTTLDAAGNIISTPGSREAAGGTKFAESRGTAAGKASIENDTTAGNLQNFDSSIQQARVLLPKVQLTGPVLGRAGAAANDPDYANLQGSLNSIVLQAKDLYNLGSGQGFSNADRDFLGDVVGGKYSRAETIGYALDRLEEVSQKRQQFLNQRNQGYGKEFGYPTTDTQVPASPTITKTLGGKTYYQQNGEWYEQ